METLTTTIRPDAAALGKVTKLNAIDQIAPRDYMTTYYFFRLPQDVDKIAVFRLLEQSLLETARQIPELMSSVCKSANERNELELRYDEDSGATISMKDYTSSSLKQQWTPGSFDDLERNHFDLKSLPTEYVLPQTEFPGRDWQVSLAMQANFIDGGLIFTGCLHHTVCDGGGLFLFWTQFGKCISSISEGRNYSQESAVINFLDRQSIFTSSPSTEPGDGIGSFPDWKMASGGGSNLGVSEYDTNRYPPVEFATYYISEEKINSLVQLLSVGISQRLTSTEAVCAFLWRHIIKARALDTEKYPESKLSIPVNTRTRMNDSLCCPRYWGNLSEPNAVARMPTSLLCGPGLRLADSKSKTLAPGLQTTSATTLEAYKAPILTAAQKIRQAIAGVDNTAIRRLVSLIEQLPQATSITWNVDRWPGPDMLIVCLNASKFNHIDFGSLLGCSAACRITVGIPRGKPDGRCMLLPPRKGAGRGIELLVQYDAETLQRLKDCAEFTDFFEWRN